MRKYLLLTLLLVSSLLPGAASLGAPLCRQSLILPRIVSATEVSAAIDNLAELRMTLDIEKSQGSKSAAHKPLEKEFKIKLRELAEHMHIDVEVLRERLRLRISELQNSEIKPEQDKKLEKEKRGRETKVVKPLFELQETITDLDSTFTDELAPYWVTKLEGSDRLIFGQRMTLGVLDLKSKKIETIVANTRASILSHDQKTVMATDVLGTLNVYSTDTLQIIDSIRLDVVAGNLSIDRMIMPRLSPSGDKIAFNHSNNIVVFEVKTGKFLSKIVTQTSRTWNRFEFASDSEVIVTNGSSIGTYIVATGEQKLSSQFSGYDLERLFVDQKNNEIIIEGRANGTLPATTGGATFIVSAKDLTKIYELDYPTVNHYSVPGTQKMLTMSSAKDPLALYEHSDLNTPVFDFNRHYLDEPKMPQVITVSEDGSTIYVLYDQNADPGQLVHVIGIDVWKRTADQ